MQTAPLDYCFGFTYRCDAATYWKKKHQYLKNSKHSKHWKTSGSNTVFPSLVVICIVRLYVYLEANLNLCRQIHLIPRSQINSVLHIFDCYILTDV